MERSRGRSLSRMLSAFEGTYDEGDPHNLKPQALPADKCVKFSKVGEVRLFTGGI